MKNVFRPGFTTKKRGWGLGLSLAKRIVEEYHHGKIWVKSTEIGYGTTFRIELKKNNQLIMSDFSDFYIKNYFISKIICNFAARNNIVYIEYV